MKVGSGCAPPEGRLPRDDWKYDEEMWDESGEEKEAPPPDRQCPRCLHFVPRESTYCTWCGKPFEDRDKDR